MRLTMYGIREWGLGGLMAVVLAGASLGLARIYPGLSVIFWAFGAVVVVCWLGVAAFFRDPDREIPPDENLIVSPADGVVKDIMVMRGADENAHFGGHDALRIGIFLSVLDVHLNRVPCQLTVKSVEMRDGVYHDARDERASTHNSAASIFCEGSACGMNFPLIVRQITGAIARRIVCPVRSGDTFAKGVRYGMIKFGSRTELYLPAESFESTVKVGDRVYGGSSVVARIKGKVVR